MKLVPMLVSNGVGSGKLEANGADDEEMEESEVLDDAADVVPVTAVVVGEESDAIVELADAKSVALEVVVAARPSMR